MNEHLQRLNVVHESKGNSAAELMKICHLKGEVELSVRVENGNMIVGQGMQNGRCAIGRFKDQIKKIGWDTLLIEGDVNLCGENQEDQDINGYYALGYLEGLMTYDQIRYLWNSYIWKNHFYQHGDYTVDSEVAAVSDQLYQLVLKDMKEIYQKMQKVIGEMTDSEYKQQLIKQDYQYNGILDAFNKIAEEKI